MKEFCDTMEINLKIRINFKYGKINTKTIIANG